MGETRRQAEEDLFEESSFQQSTFQQTIFQQSSFQQLEEKTAEEQNMKIESISKPPLLVIPDKAIEQETAEQSKETTKERPSETSETSENGDAVMVATPSTPCDERGNKKIEIQLLADQDSNETIDQLQKIVATDDTSFSMSSLGSMVTVSSSTNPPAGDEESQHATEDNAVLPPQEEEEDGVFNDEQPITIFKATEYSDADAAAMEDSSFISSHIKEIVVALTLITATLALALYLRRKSK